MQKTIFIGDLHLDKMFPKALEAFLAYLHTLESEKVDALYIIGDLFEYWLGDDCADTNAHDVAKGLREYRKNTGTPVYYIHGNRDFLLGEDYAQQCDFEILPEIHKINLYGIETLVLHGDTLCTDDAAYQEFRALVRSKEWQAKVLRLPRWLRKLKAKRLRSISKKANRNKTIEIMDVTHESVVEAVLEYDVTHIIHGHTHRPDIHHFCVNERDITRTVVGDWYTQGSVLEVTASGSELIQLPYSD